MSRHTAEQTKKEIQAILAEFDLDGDGSLSEQEINQMLAVIQASMPGESVGADIIRERYDRDGNGTIGVHEIALLQSDVTLSTVATRYMMYMGTIARQTRYFRVLAGGKVPPWAMTGSFMFSWCAIAGDVSFETYCAVRNNHGPTDTSILAFKRLFFNVTASVVMPTLTLQAVTVGMRRATMKMGGRANLYGPPVAALCTVPLLPFIWDYPVRSLTDALFSSTLGW